MKPLKLFLFLVLIVFLSSCSTSVRDDSPAEKYDSPDAALESLVQKRLKALEEKFKTTLHETGEFSYADDSDLFLEGSQKIADDHLIITIREGSETEYTFQTGVFSMADGGWSSILTQDLVFGKIDTLIDLNGDSGKEVIIDELTRHSAGEMSYKVLHADRGTGRLEKIDTIATMKEPGSMPMEPDWRVQSHIIFLRESLTLGELDKGRIPKQKIRVHSWTQWFTDEAEPIAKRRMWDAVYEWQSPELKDVSAQFPMTEDDRYQQLFLVIKNGYHDWAAAMLQDKVINLNEYERQRTGSCFLTLLFQFARGDDGMSPDPSAVRLLLKNGADPNAPSTVGCEEGTTDGYTCTCDPKIGQQLIDAGSKYALNELLDCALRHDEPDKVGKWLAKGVDPTLALKYAFEKKVPTLTASDMLARGANREEALYWAVEYEDMEMVKSLIAEGVKMPYQISSIDMGSVEKDDARSGIADKNNHELQELVLPLIRGLTFSEIRDGGEGYCGGSDLISAAGDSQRLAAVEYMLRAGADPNQFCWADPGEDQVSCGEGSALGAAEASGSAEMVELLKKYGAQKPENCK